MASLGADSLARADESERYVLWCLRFESTQIAFVKMGVRSDTFAVHCSWSTPMRSLKRCPSFRRLT